MVDRGAQEPLNSTEWPISLQIRKHAGATGIKAMFSNGKHTKERTSSEIIKVPEQTAHSESNMHFITSEFTDLLQFYAAGRTYLGRIFTFRSLCAAAFDFSFLSGDL